MGDWTRALTPEEQAQVTRLTETGRLVSKGEKRATVYFTRTPSKLGIIRRPGRGAAASEPTGGGAPDAT